MVGFCFVKEECNHYEYHKADKYYDHHNERNGLNLLPITI